MELLLPDRLRVLSGPPGPAEAALLQGDWSNMPLTTTGLLSGRSSAAFRGLIELKRTAERQPVKPREAGRESSGSSSESGERTTCILLYYFIIQVNPLPQEFSQQGWWTSRKTSLSADTQCRGCSVRSELSRLKGCFLFSVLLFLPWTFPRTSDLMPLKSMPDVRLKSSLLFWSIWERHNFWSEKSGLWNLWKCWCG